MLVSGSKVKARHALMNPSLEELRDFVIAMHSKNLYLGSICYYFYKLMKMVTMIFFGYIYLAVFTNSVMHQEKITLGKIQFYRMYIAAIMKPSAKLWGWE